MYHSKMIPCAARRACADRNSFRLYKEVDGTTLVGKYIWTEYRCTNVVSKGNMCVECAIKLPKHKYQSAPKCDHGIVGGPYPSDSKLYGSPFYLTLLKDGWKIHEADECRAKEAQQIASSMISTSDTKQTLKQPRKIKIKKAPVVTTESVMTNVEVSGPAQYVEAMIPPTKVTEIIVVKVKKLRCEGKDYYLDHASGKVYTALANGVGPYRGRYDSESNTIRTEYPDSDAEAS